MNHRKEPRESEAILRGRPQRTQRGRAATKLGVLREEEVKPQMVLVLLVLRLAPGSLKNLLGKTRFPAIALQRTQKCRWADPRAILRLPAVESSAQLKKLSWGSRFFTGD